MRTRRNRGITTLALMLAAYAFFSSSYKEMKEAGISPAKEVMAAKNTVSALFAPPVPKQSLPLSQPADVLSITDVIEGKGETALCGQKVTIRYILNLASSGVLENITSRSFVIGDKTHIRGLEQGVIGMREGGVRRLVIPPRLAYDDARFKERGVPPHTPVYAEIQLLSIARDTGKKMDCGT